MFAAKRDVELRNILRHRRWRDGEKAVDGSSVKKAMIKTRKNKGTKSYSSDGFTCSWIGFSSSATDCITNKTTPLVIIKIYLHCVVENFTKT